MRDEEQELAEYDDEPVDVEYTTKPDDHEAQVAQEIAACESDAAEIGERASDELERRDYVDPLGWPQGIEIVEPFQLIFPLEPKPAPRARSMPYLTRDANGNVKAAIRFLNYRDYTEWKEAFAAIYREAGGPVFGEGDAVGIEILCRFKIAQTRARLPKFRTGLHARVMAPDFDNLAKSPADALKKIAYPDDKQVSYACVLKYESSLFPPAVRLTIGRLSI
jgi:Holliday junction resolvase RusA-like endonuclease